MQQQLIMGRYRQCLLPVTARTVCCALVLGCMMRADGYAGTNQTVGFLTANAEPFSVEIEKTHDTYLGRFEQIDVFASGGSELMGAFNIVLAYDASVLDFRTAFPGQMLWDCGWEYFTYRRETWQNCGNACPSGILRVVGIAEIDDCDNHPDCFGIDGQPLPFTLFTLEFLVSSDRTLECMFVPIRFFWGDCGDNVISSVAGDTLYISDHVFDYAHEVGYREITDLSFGYPTYYGAQDEDCFPGDTSEIPLRMVDLYNGGIHIICAGSIDIRGDINLNEIRHELADAELFANYFVYGLSVFNINPLGQIAASDVNADGLTLSVADLVYLIRVITGDAVPYEEISPVSCEWTADEYCASIDTAVAACCLVIAGYVTPELLATNMDMEYQYDGHHTRVLIYSMEYGQTFRGEFLVPHAEILSAEFSTYEGAPMTARRVQDVRPEAFSLHQNYPNPFNTSTRIGFQLEPGTKYTLTMYNSAGREITRIVDRAGCCDTTLIDWDASGLASGVYLYRLEARNRSVARKMMLVK